MRSAERRVEEIMVQQLTRTSLLLDQEAAPDEDDLIARYIGPHPDKRGRAYARLRDYGPSVSAIIRDLKADRPFVETAASWELPDDAVRAAIAFYRQHRAFVDARILLEDDEWSDWFDQFAS